MTLKVQLKEWTDFDVACYELAIALGLMKREEHHFAIEAKHVFWSRHPVGETLYTMLHHLTKIGVMEYDVPNMQFRWNSEYKGSWEK